MRKIFTLFTLCMLAMTAWGETVIEFTPGDPAGTNTQVSGADEMTKGGITVKTTSGAFNATQFRFGKNATTTITSTVGNIIKIEFTCTKDNPASGFDEGQNIVVDGYNGTWTGNSAEITLTSNNKQVRATKIVFTVGGDGLGAPGIKPAAGTYYSEIEVTITCGTAGAKIYYTTDGTDPTTSSTEYTAPFKLSSNTTVKAISALNGKTSDVVSAAYEFANATPVANIAAFQQVADETMVTFTNPVNVLVQYGQRMFVMDNSGYALFYGTPNQTYKNGDVIPAGFAGLKTTWDGEPELKELVGFQAASSNSPINPITGNAANVDHEHFGQFMIFKNATISKDGSNYTLTDENGNQCAIYFGSMGVSAPTDLNKLYDVEAIVGSYGKTTVWQLLPTKLTVVGGDDPQPVDGYALCELGDVADNTTVTIKNDAIVLGQSGQYLYLKDTECGYGLMYGNCGQTYDFGDVIPAGFGGLKTTWDGEPELKNLTGFKTPTTEVSATLEPETITPAQVAHETWGQYVLLKSVIIDVDAKTLTANGETCPYYNDRFGIELPTDGKTHDVYGIVGSHGKAPNTVYQILPLSINKKPGRKGIPEVECLANAYALNKGQNFHFVKPLTAVYQNKEKKDLYVLDACGEFGLVYGEVEGTFDNGDIINDAVASWTTYNDNKQLTPNASTFVSGGKGTPVDPEYLPIEEISQDLIHNYLAFEDITIVKRVETVNDKEQTNYYLKDETGEMMLYDRYSIGVADNDLTKTYDVEGFLTIFSSNRIMEIYPIKIKEHSGLPTDLDRFDVNHDGEINLADVNKLIDYILSGSGFHDCNMDGEMGIGDVNDLIDYILSN